MCGKRKVKFMALIAGQLTNRSETILIMFLVDPHRHRATIWRKSPNGIFSIHLRTMVDKDQARLRRRAAEFMEKQHA